MTLGNLCIYDGQKNFEECEQNDDLNGKCGQLVSIDYELLIGDYKALITRIGAKKGLKNHCCKENSLTK